VLHLYADEQFPLPVVQRLRAMGYDVLTVQDAGQANRKIPDDEVLKFATTRNRAVITENRRDFVKLHRQFPDHAGIIVCSKNLDWDSHAANIHTALENRGSIAGELVRVTR
jgi:predicted nuclease of predicted toxin-antitoxin system